MKSSAIVNNMWKLCFYVLLCSYAYALTDDEFKVEFTKKVMVCLKDNPVDMKEMTNLQAMKVPKTTESKCLLACAYKSVGTLDEKGMYNVEAAYKLAELLKNGDEKRLVNGKKLADICSKVNDVEVSDGDKGCDRAALMFKCTIANAPKLGFKV